mmetsp:Transcript_5973/g.6108  ORF Transcript_5973/g.6108 Transcript_5973/m.6108 type:complete len:223 (-) Transcript_5973:10-678(-)
MKVFQFLILFVAITTICPALLHYFQHSVISNVQIALSFFLSLNSLICLWEISLGLYITHISNDYKKLSQKYEKNRLQCIIDFMVYKLTVNEMFSLKYWSRIWSTYSLYDPSYSNRESFGFFVDVGNGWTTLLPSILFLYSMTFPVFEARTMGLIGIIKFYQEFYGTCIYFTSFIMNKRYIGKSFFEVVLFVGVSNGLWFFFPLLGMITSYEMIQSNTYNVFM